MSHDNLNIKDIPGFEGLYAVTPDGKVYSHRRERFLKTYTNKSRLWGSHGRPLIGLCVSGEFSRQFVSKLVYLTYKGPIPKGYDVDHENGDKADNRIENLRLLTRSENMLSYFELQGLTNQKHNA